MFTIAYKGWFIHGYVDVDGVKIQSPQNVIMRVRSIHAAKCLITRRMNRL